MRVTRSSEDRVYKEAVPKRRSQEYIRNPVRLLLLLALR